MERRKDGGSSREPRVLVRPAANAVAARCGGAAAYARALVRERVAWAMLIGTSPQHASFDGVASEWRSAAAQLAACASALAAGARVTRRVPTRLAGRLGRNLH